MGSRTSTAKWPNLPSWCCTMNWVRPSLSRSTCADPHSGAAVPHASHGEVAPRNLGQRHWDSYTEQGCRLSAVTRLQGHVGNPVLLDLGGVLVDGVGQLLRGWATIVAIVPAQKEDRFALTQTSVVAVWRLHLHACPNPTESTWALTKVVSAHCDPERDFGANSHDAAHVNCQGCWYSAAARDERGLT